MIYKLININATGIKYKTPIGVLTLPFGDIRGKINYSNHDKTGCVYIARKPTGRINRKYSFPIKMTCEEAKRLRKLYGEWLASLPSIEDLIDPDFTNGVDSVEFIRRKRDAI